MIALILRNLESMTEESRLEPNSAKTTALLSSGRKTEKELKHLRSLPASITIKLV